MGAVSLGGIVASGLALNEPGFCFKTDRASIVLSILNQTPSYNHGIDSTMKDPRSRLDCATIAVQSDRDRGVLPRILPIVRWKSEAPCVSMKRIKSGLTVAVRSRSCGLHVDEDNVPRVATWRQVSLPIAVT